MDTGGLAFIDCLGFKGIWKNHRPEDVLARLREARELADKELQQWGAVVPAARIQHVFLSDTIVIGAIPAQRGPIADVGKGFLVMAAAAVALQVTKKLIRGDPPLTLRGCVTFGDFILEDNHIIGPAVDDAAEAHELANGAFIWIRPELVPLLDAFDQAASVRLAQLTSEQALELLGRVDDAGFIEQLVRHVGNRQEAGEKIREVIVQRGLREEFLPYDVPMKDGGTVSCKVVNPLCATTYPREIIARYDRSMTSDAEPVRNKRENTLAFLEFAEQQHRAFSEARHKILRWESRL